jgi:hypothetical protein
MKYVERDKDGLVKGVYACRQPGYAEELLDDDHTDIQEFDNRQAEITEQKKPLDEEATINKLKDFIAELNDRVTDLEKK